MNALRADAERNRSSLLCAAATVFDEQGTGAPLEDVAKAAGVGIATLYRRFPTREALIEAVFDAKMSQYADDAEDAAARAQGDPWPAFRDHVGGLVERQIADPVFGTVLLRPLQGSSLFEREHGRAFAATRLLVERARGADGLRADLDHTDLYLLLVSVSALVARPGPLDPAVAARRLARLFLDSCRPVAP